MYRYYVSLSMAVHKESKHDFLKYDNKSTDCNMCMMKLFKEILWEKQRKTGIVKNKGLERRSQWVTLLQWLILPIHISSPVVLYQDHSMRTPVFTLCVGCSLIWQTLFLKLLEDPLFKKKNYTFLCTNVNYMSTLSAYEFDKLQIQILEGIFIIDFFLFYASNSDSALTS